MAELTLEQKKAIALANARLRTQEPQQIGETEKTLGQEAIDVAKGTPSSLSMVARGLAAPTVGAIGGGAIGGPAGALAGALAVPAGDILASGYNALVPENYQVQYPSTAVQNLLTKAGMPVPESMTDRALVAGGGALGGVGSQIPALTRLATTAETQAGRNVAEQLSQAPGRQLAAAAPAGATSQVVSEATDSPTLGTLAGGIAALPFAVGARSQLTKRPSIDDVKAQASEQYDIAKLSGLEFKNNAFKQNAVNIQKTLMQEGLDKDLHPNVTAALNRLLKDGTPKTLQNVETLRKIAKAPAASINADERRLAQIMLEKLDDFVDNAQPNQLVSKADMNAPAILKDARKLWSQSKKAEILEDIFNTAELRAGANYTQSGMENALRNRLVNLAANKKQMRAFTPDERKAITEAAKGGSVQNALRFLGKLSPTSVIAGAGGSYIGASLLGPAGALIAPVVGAASRAGATQLGLKNFEELQKRLLTGSQPIRPNVSPSQAVIGRGLLGDFQADPLLEKLGQ